MDDVDHNLRCGVFFSFIRTCLPIDASRTETTSFLREENKVPLDSTIDDTVDASRRRAPHRSPPNEKKATPFVLTQGVKVGSWGHGLPPLPVILYDRMQSTVYIFNPSLSTIASRPNFSFQQNNPSEGCRHLGPH